VRVRGFTLVEVLVALAIAAVGLAAVLATVTNATRNAIYMRDKTLASWIALNQIAEARLGSVLPSVDRTTGDADYAGLKWKWQRTVTQTEVPGVRRLDVSVRFADAADDAWIATVSGFVGRTQLASQPSSTPWEGVATAPATGGNVSVPGGPGVPRVPRAPGAPAVPGPPNPPVQP
jgi:general secretion pathway protein I